MARTVREMLLYNTASRKKEVFTPAEEVAGMYCCGPTVYNYAHVGNLRTYLFEDVLKRALGSCGQRVKHVVNITDVGHLTSDADTGEDKMEKGSRREGKSVWQIAEEYTRIFMENLADLNIVEPDLWPRATDHIPEMIDMIRTLEDKGYTYPTSDGIYFDTSTFPSYGDFAGLDPSSLKAGSRVSMGEKRHATDFALWKLSPADVKRQMEWESPWGIGFPGWHIECCVMSLKYLPQPIDIHCGGTDHIRVHHTNEIAQAEAATGKRFVRFWLHGEFLTLDSGKMAKSGHEFITLDTLRREGIDPLTFRLFCYSAHYRSPLAFSWEGVQGARQGLMNLRKLARAAAREAGEMTGADRECDELLGPFYEAVCDDLNMPKAMASVWDVVRSPGEPAHKVAALRRADEILALDLFSALHDEEEVKMDSSGTVKLVVSPDNAGTIPVEQIFNMVLRRKEARTRRDYVTADAIRGELVSAGVQTRDLPDGTTECRIINKKE